ncbi:MAG: rod shape-determining protein MreC [Fimbriimonadaceae bacterium]|nr:rod shape-determining protein MreC [Fimbriimonadaceae bacterium]
MILLGVGATLGVIQNQARRAGRLDAATALVQGVFAGPAAAVRQAAKANGARWRAVWDSAMLDAELDRLYAVERASAAYLDRIHYYEAEVRRLETLSSAMGSGHSTVRARIAGLNPYAHRITLTVGSRDGIEPGMPVVNGEGLLALVETVGAGQCQALLLTSAASKFGGITVSARPVAGLVRGYTPGRLLIELLQEGEVTPGQEVVTSGYSATIPRGLVVGTVLEVSTDPSLGVRQAILLPSARVGNSLEVEVLR